MLTGKEVALEPGDLDLLLSVPTGHWVPEDDLVDPAAARRLAERGLLVSNDPGEPFAELRARDERLTAIPWQRYAALHRSASAWTGLEVAVSDEAPPVELEETLHRGSPAFVERYGPPPPHFHEVGEAAPLPSPDRDGALYELLGGRRTTRGFDSGRPLSTAELSTVLGWVWGCRGTAALGDDVVVLKKTSPSGGSLHPIEVYPLVRAVEGVEPGLYHYSVERHGLTMVERLDAAGAEALADVFLGGQWYFASAPVLFVMAARFDRSFWKYRDHDKAYGAILIDAGHLSQTLYLVAEELGPRRLRRRRDQRCDDRRPSRPPPVRAGCDRGLRLRPPGAVGARAAVRALRAPELTERLGAAREAAGRGQAPLAVPPDARLRPDLGVVGLVEDDAPRLAAATRPRLPETGGDGDDHAALAAAPDLELVALAHRSLVDVPGEDQLRSGVDEGAEDVVAAGDRALPRPPRRPGQLVVEECDPQHSGRRVREGVRGALELRVAEPPGLVAPRAHRVQPDDAERVGAMDGLRRSPQTLELRPGAGEPRGERVRDVVVPGDRDDRRTEPTQERSGRIVLLVPSPVRQVAGGDDHIGSETPDERGQRLLDVGCGVPPGVQVGDVENPGWHGRPSL